MLRAEKRTYNPAPNANQIRVARRMAPRYMYDVSIIPRMVTWVGIILLGLSS